VQDPDFHSEKWIGRLACTLRGKSWWYFTNWPAPAHARGPGKSIGRGGAPSNWHEGNSSPQNPRAEIPVRLKWISFPIAPVDS
jgi:hypothetical protein